MKIFGSIVDYAILEHYIYQLNGIGTQIIFPHPMIYGLKKKGMKQIKHEDFEQWASLNPAKLKD